MIIQSIGFIVAICAANLAYLSFGDFFGAAYYYITVFGFFEADQIVWNELIKEQNHE